MNKINKNGNDMNQPRAHLFHFNVIQIRQDFCNFNYKNILTILTNFLNMIIYNWMDFQLVLTNDIAIELRRQIFKLDLHKFFFFKKGL